MLWLLSDDLLFSSRITAAARNLGLPFRVARDTRTLLEAPDAPSPRCVIVDLSNPGLDIVDFVQHLRNAFRPKPFVAAYGSHVDTETLRAAREAGCDVVWPRSKFAEEFERSLTSWIAHKTD